MADEMRVIGRKGNWTVKWLCATAKRVGLEAVVNRQVGGSRAVHALFEMPKFCTPMSLSPRPRAVDDDTQTQKPG